MIMSISCIQVTATGLDELSLMAVGNAWGLQVGRHSSAATDQHDRPPSPYTLRLRGAVPPLLN